MRNLLAPLQKKPYEIRIKILWGTVLIFGLILLLIWFFSLRREIQNLNEVELLGSGDALGAQSAETGMIAVERVEFTETSLKVFFKVTNTQDDILNFSSRDDIELNTGDQNLNPIRILDRQNKTFVAKILNQTHNFGTLIFPVVSAYEVSLAFDNLFFEKNPEQLFKETLQLDLEALKKDQELRK